MLTIEKKIRAELRRLEKYLYCHETPVEGWEARRGYYRKPGQYDMTDGEGFPLSKGQHIGEKDLTVFLKNTVKLDESYKGQTVVLLLTAGGEGCVSVNGQHYNGLDYNRNMILLTKCAEGTESYRIEAEIYCKDLILDSATAFQCDVCITQSELAAIDHDIWNYYFDVKTGFDFIEGSREEYTRQRVMKVIYDSFLKLDYYDLERLRASAKEAEDAYLEGMARYKDLKVPAEMYFAGHSHIDVAWHWPLKETVRKVSRTFSSMLRLMEQYDDFKFCQSMPVLYEMAKRYYPEVYEQIKARVAEGRWETLGSMYLEPDCNLISGESFVRQIMYGKKFYKEELNSDSNICFLPDVFGYSPALPQILKKAGTDYFFTTKLTWNETNEFPYSVFKWRGLDGTEVLAGMMSMCTDRGLGLYNGDLTPEGVRMSMDYFKNKDNGDPLLYLYGHGDGGGGVTKEMLEAVTRLDKVPMMPKIKMGTVSQYFESLDKEKDYPVWSGEMYFEKHRGTYTTAAKNKKNNRKSEFLFRNAEILSVLGYLSEGTFKGADLEEGWKLILLNQFHDILPGTCIGPVYEQCDRQYARIAKIGEESIEENLKALTAREEGFVTVYNTLSWKRTQVVTVDGKGRGAVKDCHGNYPKQARLGDGRIAFLAEEVPAMGYRTYELTDGNREEREWGSVSLSSDNGVLWVENSWLEIKVDQKGEIISLYDKTAGRQVLKKGQSGNQLKLLEDIPVEWGSAWETTEKRNDRPPVEVKSVHCEMKEHNELYTVIGIEKEIHHSVIRQDMIVYHHGPYIQFKTVVDWDERHKMLRTAFPVDVHTMNARYDVAFGNAEQPNHRTTSFDRARFEVCGYKWGDVSDGGFGVTLLNDCKYGYSIQDSDMELSLLRSADHPSDTCDRGTHSFSYWIYPHRGDVRQGRVAQAGYEVNVSLIAAEGKTEKGEGSFLYTDCENIIIDTVKKAEDGDDIIIRFFETYNTVSRGHIYLNFDVKECWETDLLEREISRVSVEERGIPFKINPYEIKTYRIHL